MGGASDREARPVTGGWPLTRRFADALAYATEVHTGQSRKGTSVPYVSHVLAVCALVLEDGGGEDEAIGALLHDAVEGGGGRPVLRDYRALGERLWDRFTATPEETLWYYRELVEAFRQPDHTALTGELERVVSELEAERKRKLEGR